MPLWLIFMPGIAAQWCGRVIERKRALAVHWRLTGPIDPPPMDHQPLTLRELYATLYNLIGPIAP